MCCLFFSFFFYFLTGLSIQNRAGLRGAMGEHLAREGHGGRVLFNEVEDLDAEHQHACRWCYMS